MPLVMNASSKKHKVRALGSYFLFEPGQVKNMEEDRAAFLTSQAAYLGFVSLPEEFSDPDYAKSPAGSKLMAERKAEGIQRRIQHLEWLKNNELKSLRNDMDRANLKAETASEFTIESASALRGALEELKEYRAKKNDAVQAEVAKIEELTKLLEE